MSIWGWQVVCSISLLSVQRNMFLTTSETSSSEMWMPVPLWQNLNRTLSFWAVIEWRSQVALIGFSRIRSSTIAWGEVAPKKPSWQCVKWSLLCKETHGWKALVKTWRECWKVSVVCIHVCAFSSACMTWCACTPQTTSSLSNSTTLVSLTLWLSTKNIHSQCLVFFLLSVRQNDHNAYPLVAMLFSWQCASFK